MSPRFLFPSLLALPLLGCGAATSPQHRPPRSVAPAEAPPPIRPADLADEAEPPRGRLPGDVVPRHYTLDLEIRPDMERFGGRVRIDLELQRPRSVIWLHGQGLRVRETTVRFGQDVIEARWEEVLPRDGVAALRLARPVGPGQLQVEFDFSAPFFAGLEGLYRVEVEGKHYAFTQMEPVSARRVFPCFDEPAFKTPFEVTLRGRKEDVLLSNAPARQERIEKGSVKVVRFAETAPLPTYLVAFAAGPFDVVEAEPVPPNDVRRRPLPLRGVTVAGRGARIREALSRTGAIVAELERYFGQPYPFAKLDLVAVPDFGSGAMENAGLVTFREWFLLWDDASSEAQKRAFLSITAHELAHQWFGNLVTLPWWDELWLNESFATWMANVTIARLAPDHRPWVSRWRWLDRAMHDDSLASARRIRNPIESRHDISSAFDAITYAKGAAVLYMVQQWLGEAPFRRGIRRYLQEHAGGHGSAKALFEALQAASNGRPVARVMRAFTDQEGIPLVRISARCSEAEGGEATLVLEASQRRYLPLGSGLQAERIWHVPLCLRLEGIDAPRCELLSEPEQSWRWSLPSCPDWIAPNASGAGYYRASMPPDWTARLFERAWSRLPAAEQVAAADSLIAATHAGALPLKDALGRLAPLAASPIPIVSDKPRELLSWLASHLADPRHRDRARRLGWKIYGPVARRLGWRHRPEDSGDRRLLRAQLWRALAVDLRNPRAERQAAALGRKMLRGPDEAPLHADTVEPELRGVALAAALRRGGAPVFDRLSAALSHLEEPSLRREVLYAIGQATDETLASRARDLVLDPKLRRNEVMTILWHQIAHRETREAAWRWFREHFQGLVERLGWERLGWSPWLGSTRCRAEAAEELRTFFEPRVDRMPGAPRNLAGAVESIQLCAALRAHLDAQASEALGGP